MKKMFFGKIKITAICICLVLCSLLSSCAARINEGIELLENSFRCEIRWGSLGQDMTATLEIGARRDAGERDIVMKLLSPKLLTGCELTRLGGVCSMSFDGVKLGQSTCEAYLSVAEMLIPAGGFSFVCRYRAEGETLECYSSGDNKWYFSSDGIPKRIENAERALEVVWIEQKQG